MILDQPQSILTYSSDPVYIVGEIPRLGFTIIRLPRCFWLQYWPCWNNIHDTFLQGEWFITVDTRGLNAVFVEQKQRVNSVWVNNYLNSILINNALFLPHTSIMLLVCFSRLISSVNCLLLANAAIWIIMTSSIASVKYKNNDAIIPVIKTFNFILPRISE